MVGRTAAATTPGEILMTDRVFQCWDMGVSCDVTEPTRGFSVDDGIASKTALGDANAGFFGGQIVTSSVGAVYWSTAKTSSYWDLVMGTWSCSSTEEDAILPTLHLR